MPPAKAEEVVSESSSASQKTKAQLKAERKAAFEAQNSSAKPAAKDTPKSKAERRAIQEAQRAAKGTASTGNEKEVTKPQVSDLKSSQNQPVKPKEQSGDCQPAEARKSSSPPKVTKPESLKSSTPSTVRLFSHLPQYHTSEDLTKELGVGSCAIHPAVVTVGLQMSKGIIVGSNARAIATLTAFKEVIQEYTTPPQKELPRDLKAKIDIYVKYLEKCRPLSVSMVNSIRHLTWLIAHTSPTTIESKAKENLCEGIDQFLQNEIDYAMKGIADIAVEKIADGDVILTYSSSSVVKKVLCTAQESKKVFRVIVVDSRPRLDGKEMLQYLVNLGIKCSYVMINSVSYVMKEVTKVILGAHCLQANGYVMSRVGSSQIAVVAHSYNVPVLVCCETYKFSERVHTDSFVYNELADPSELADVPSSTTSSRQDGKSASSLSLLNLMYDITPPDIVSGVITEKGMLPCSSVPVMLRVKSFNMEESAPQ